MPEPAHLLAALYAAALLAIAWRRRGGDGVEYLLAGRTLTLPAFVATLVTTWYGGVLGIGEFAWRHGIATWVVFGLPYYLAAALFALFLARRLRDTEAVSIPELLTRRYGRAAGRTGAAAILLQTIPAAYVLMLGTLLSTIFGWPLVPSVLLGAAFSAFYVGLAGFRSVVRTDALQMALMYGGFALIVPAALARAGGLGAVWTALPAAHRSWDGGLGWQTVAVWYLIALQTLVEPAFYQRVFAARDREVARTGVLAAILCWSVFDFLTVTAGLAARVLLPHLADPVAAYPALAELVLGPWPRALFLLGLLATVMSTLDSYLFLAAATVGHDLLAPATGAGDRRLTRTGLLLGAGAAAGGALAFSSVVTLWHHVGTVVTSSLLLPVLGIHLPERLQPASRTVAPAIVTAAVTATLWIAGGNGGRYPLGVEPMFPALAVSGLVLAAGAIHARKGVR